MTVSPDYPLRVGGVASDVETVHRALLKFDAYDAEKRSLDSNPAATEEMLSTAGAYVAESLAELFLATGGHIQCSMFLAPGQCYCNGDTIYVSHDIYERSVLGKINAGNGKGKRQVSVES